MADSADWRLMGQIRYLFKRDFFYAYYEKDEDWDHHHCAFCTKRIDDQEKKFYCTNDQYYWLCEKCYNDFKDMFQFRLLEEEAKEDEDRSA
jgi:hypothetical protein